MALLDLAVHELRDIKDNVSQSTLRPIELSNILFARGREVNRRR
jgi:hypothetical protein